MGTVHDSHPDCRAALHDDIFQGGMPVLPVVDAHQPAAISRLRESRAMPLLNAHLLDATEQGLRPRRLYDR
jgi:hypothetical protein